MSTLIFTRQECLSCITATTPEINQLIKRRGFLWLSFGGFNPLLVGHIALGPVAGSPFRQEHMKQAAQLMATSKQRQTYYLDSLEHSLLLNLLILCYS